MDIAKVLAVMFRAEYVTVTFHDIENGLGGVTFASSGKHGANRRAVHEYFMRASIRDTLPQQFTIHQNEKPDLPELRSTVVCPVPCTSAAKGAIFLASSNSLDFKNVDIRVLSTISQLLNGEIDALHGNNTANAVVVLNVAVQGWQALLTSYTWRQLTGIRNGNLLSKVFDVADSSIPVSGSIYTKRDEGGATWEYVLDMQPAKLSGDTQIWFGIMLSATEISHDSDIALAQPGLEPSVCISDVSQGVLLGKGGFGSVYRGIWQGRAIAVKILEQTTSTPTEKLQEAKIGERLDHVNIVKTLASGCDYTETGNTYSWILMELCDKGTLWQAVECGYFHIQCQHDGSRLPDMQKIVRTALQIADGMLYLHENDILHGDLNCNNILMSNDMTAKISDLGLSRIFAGNTLDTDTYGTISHQPPELLATGQLSLSSDTYSFGVVLYEMCAGYRAYCGLRPAQIITLKLSETTLELPPVCPREWNNFVEMCLARQHTQRPSFYEIRSWLLRFGRDNSE